MARPILLSLGSVNADFQVRVPEAPDPGRTLPATDFTRLSGGKAANRAVLACRLGHPARLLARVGDDDLREQALAPLRRAGIDLGGVSVAEGVATAVSMIAVLPDGKKSIVLAGNANDSWRQEDGEAAAAAIAAAPAGSLLAVDCEIPPDVAARAIAAARGRGLAVVLDPSPADRVRDAMLAQATAVTPNPSEAEGLTGVRVDGPEAGAEAARRLAGRGVAIACVKLQDGGCVLWQDGRATHIPSVPVEVVDSTGAGDAFAGALAVALLEGRPVLEAACFAVAASHLAVTAFGSQEAYPGRDRIEALLPRLAAGQRGLAGR
ncbi:ribokinase [Teichococcus aestuarii]|uniref:ribokinase n=1 Tax=Teichococcus aestuarii TaxID=568898 RepID=UPI00361A8233